MTKKSFRQIIKNHETYALVILAALLLLSVVTGAAQSQTSPTPAPTKTPSPQPEAAQIPTATVAREASSDFQSFSQSDLARLTANVQRPNGIFWFNGKLYVACTGDSTIYEIDAETGETNTYIYGIRNAHSMYVENDASNVLTLWVPDYETNTLTRVTRAGVRTVASDLRGPWGIAYLNESEFLITSLLGNSLSLVDRQGATEIKLNDLAGPTGIIIADNMLYIANTGSTRRAIEWYPLDDVLDGKFTREDAASQVLVRGLQNTSGLQMDSDGYLYFAYALGTRGVIGRVNPDLCREKGGCTNEDVEIVLYSDLDAPLAGLTISPDSRLFIHAMFSPDIYSAQLGTGS